MLDDHSESLEDMKLFDHEIPHTRIHTVLMYQCSTS